MYKFLIKYRIAINRMLLGVSLVGALFAEGIGLRSFFLGMASASGLFTLGELYAGLKKSRHEEKMKQ